jgi:hypothetical protein
MKTQPAATAGRFRIGLRTSPFRTVKRWEHEVVLDAMQERLDRAPKTMRIRRQTAEHPFGTIKAWMGATHFRLRTLEKVSAEMAFTFSPTI